MSDKPITKITLDRELFDYYASLAARKGIPLATYLRSVLLEKMHEDTENSDKDKMAV